jgi:hypothetical protein
MPFRLAERAIFQRGHGGRHMVGSRSGSLFEHADCFGFGRVMFGGDRPVPEFATSYQGLHRSDRRHHRKYILE